MDENILNFARIELRAALMDKLGKNKGQLEAFRENSPADKTRKIKPIHTIELDDGRVVKAENRALYVLETRTRRRPLPPIDDNDLAAAPWRRAVNALMPHQQAWLRYCYGFDLAFKHQIAICEAVWSEFEKSLPSGLLRKTKKRLIELAWLAVQDVAATRGNETYQEYAGAELARQLGVSRSTWCEVYRPHWQGLKDSVSAMDEVALAEVLKNHRDHIFDDVCI